MRILVAEDNVVIQNLLRSLLVKWGYEVIIAEDGEEAWAHLKRDDGPALAVLDWMMPAADGLEVCRRVRAQKRGSYVYILLLSARSDSEDIVEALGMGADDYITKPFHANELRARIRTAVRILKLQEDLARQAHHDSLTGLPNRRLLADRLEQALYQANRHGELVGFFYVDLDHFKIVNDCLGHALGDQLLQQVAARLRGCVRDCDTLARVGGDEFVLVASSLRSREEAPAMAARLLTSLEPPLELGEHQVRVTASIGMALYPDDGSDMSTLQRNADEAMYVCKRSGRCGFQFFIRDIRPFQEDGPSGRQRAETPPAEDSGIAGGSTVQLPSGQRLWRAPGLGAGR